MSDFTQIAEGSRNASLRPIAVLALEPSDFASRYGLEFHPDDSDETVAALLQIRSGQQFMLLRHVDAPLGGTEVLADEASDHPHHDLLELLDALSLSDHAITWALDAEQPVFVKS